MRYVHGSVALLLVCIATMVDAQVKCNPVSFTVTAGWCKDKAVSYKGCFDAAAQDTDKTSKAAFITASQALFAPYSQTTCLAGATVLCGAVGGKPKDWDCKEVNNECSGDNLSNNVGVGACNTDAQCTAFAKSTMNICCDAIKKHMTDLICDNADKTKIDALFVDGNFLCVLHTTCVWSNSTYISVLISYYYILTNICEYICVLVLDTICLRIHAYTYSCPVRAGPVCATVDKDKDCRKANGSSSSRASILNTLAVGAMTAVLATMTAS